jgi:hypothetical protein
MEKIYKLGTVSYEHNGYLHKGVINHDAVKIVTFFDPQIGTKTFDNVINWINTINNINVDSKSINYIENLDNFTILNEEIDKLYNINF